MNDSGGRASARVFARAIEQRWGALLGRPVLLSPKDWVAISEWHAREIPLSLVLETLTETCRGGSSGAVPRSLAHAAAAVEEAWRVVLEGRRRPDRPSPQPVDVDPVACWLRRAASEPVGSTLRSMLERLLAELRSGAPGVELDARLDAEIEASVADDLLRTVRECVDEKLAPFRERIGAGAIERTRRAAVVAGLRRALALPPLVAHAIREGHG